MSSDWCAAEQGNRAHQRVRTSSKQHAKLSEAGVSQPPELEESSQAKTTQRGMRVPTQRRMRLPRTLRFLDAVMECVLHCLLHLARPFSTILMHPPRETHLVTFRVSDARSKLSYWRAQFYRQGASNEWVLDSGVWMHHTSNLDLLLEGGDFQFQEIDNKDASFSSSRGDASYVQGRGSVRTKRFQFPGVGYVAGDDDDARNVVSVAQLARDHGLVTVFEPTSCHVKHKKTGQIVGKGTLRNGMYMLDYLRIVGGQNTIGDGEIAGKRRDGGRGHGGEGGGNGGDDSTAQGHAAGARDGRGGGTGARNQKGGSGSGAAGGDVVNEIVEEEEGCDEKEIQEINDNDQGDIMEIDEQISGNGEKEEDKRRGRSNSGQSSLPHTGLFGLSRLALILWIAVCIFGIAACKLLPYTSWGTRATILPMDFHSLAGFWVLFILSLQLLRACMMQSTICKAKQIWSLFRGRIGDGESKEEEETWAGYLQESHREYSKRLFGLSRYDGTTDKCRQLPAGAFPTSTNTARWEEFLVDSGASFHATWKESILFPYPQHLQNHTKPPTRSFGGIVGSIAVTRSGYLNGDNIMLDGVLLAPESRMNLVSVGQLSIQYQVQVEMDNEGVIIKKKQDGVQIGGGKMINNHQYVLERFEPTESLLAHNPTPNFRVFGRRRPAQ